MVLADFSDRCTRCVLEVESLCARAGRPRWFFRTVLKRCATGCVCHRGAVVCVNGPLDGRRNASGPASPETVTAVPVIDTAAWTFFRARGTQCLCWRWTTRWVRLAVTRPGVRLGARRRCLRLGAWRGVLRWLHLPARCVRPRRSARRASSVRFGGRSLVGAALCAPVDGGHLRAPLRDRDARSAQCVGCEPARGGRPARCGPALVIGALPRATRCRPAPSSCRRSSARCASSARCTWRGAVRCAGGSIAPAENFVGTEWRGDSRRG